jgi:hypothetical protein
MTVIHRHHPEVKLDQTQVDLIQEKLLNEVDVNPLGEAPPQFLNSKFTQGAFWITCANESSTVWLMWTVDGLGELWEGMELTVVDSKDLPKRPRVLVPNTLDATVMSCLRIQNPELNTADWYVMSQKVVG